MASTFAGTVTAPNLNLTSLTNNVASSSVLVINEITSGELVTNGDFDTNSDWTNQAGTNWSISGGKASVSNTGNIRYFQQTGVLGNPSVNKKYLITWTISGLTQGGIGVNVGGYITTTIQTSNGTYQEEITPTNASSNTILYLQSNANTIGSVDDVSVKEITSATNEVQKRNLKNGAFGDELWAVTPTDSDNIYNLNSGNVGIGTTSPGSKLTVNGQVQVGPDAARRYALQPSQWGYASSYRTLILGSASTTYNTNDTGSVTLAFGVDVSANASGAFTGNGSELIFRNGAKFITPNTANNGYNSNNLVLKDQSVGIGIAPAAGFGLARLSLGTGAVANEIITFVSASGGNAELRNTSSSGTFTFTNSDGLSEKMRITSGGNVGIGETSPAQKLDVVLNDGATNTVADVIRVSHTTTGTPAVGLGAGIQFSVERVSSSVNLSRAAIYGTNGTVAGNEGSSGNFTIYTRTDTGPNDQTSGMNEKFRITDRGNIGQAVLPITDPYITAGDDAEQWQTYQIGKAGVFGAYKKNNESMFGFNTYVAAPSGNNKAIEFSLNGTATRYYADRISFHALTSNATTGIQTQAETVRILSSGNVGIGTGTPSSYDGESDDLVVASGVDGAVPTPGITIACLGDTATTGRGALRFADGTSSNAPYRGALEYNHNGDDMFFRTSGTIKMTLDTSGNVGIGTTSPGSKLDIGTSSGASMQFLYDTSQAYRNNISNYWNSSTDSRMDFNIGRTANVAPVTVMSVGYGGNVGIGTTSPSSKLQVKGDICVNSESVSTATEEVDKIVFKKSHPNGVSGYYELGEIRSKTYGGYSGGLNFYTGRATTPGSYASTFAMAIDNFGNVGIGTDSPSSILHIDDTSASVTKLTIGHSGEVPIISAGGSNTDLQIQAVGAGGYINFNTGSASTLRMRITADAKVQMTADVTMSGSVGIGETTLQRKFNLYDGTDTWTRVQCGASTADWIHGIAGSDHTYKWYNQSSNGGVGYKMALATSGTLTVSADLVAYGSPSDKRLKENIKPIQSALDKVSKLQGVTFDWKEKGITNLKEDIGFIAQDVRKVIPELVRENEDGMLSMRHQGIAPILLEAIKELKAEIEELKKHKCNCNK